MNQSAAVHPGPRVRPIWDEFSGSSFISNRRVRRYGMNSSSAIHPRSRARPIWDEFSDSSFISNRRVRRYGMNTPPDSFYPFYKAEQIITFSLLGSYATFTLLFFHSSNLAIVPLIVKTDSVLRFTILPLASITSTIKQICPPKPTLYSFSCDSEKINVSLLFTSDRSFIA